MKNFDQAVTQVEAAIEDDPTSTAYANLGELQVARGKSAEAEAAFKKAIDVDPASVDAKLALANFYWLSKRPAEAEAVHESTPRVRPQQPAGESHAGGVLPLYGQGAPSRVASEGPG